MSEYMIDGVLLTNIADAVRAVDGSSSTLTPAQMQARLTAVKSSIDAALSALTAKEVEVPSGSNVHGLADLIAAIEAGGSVSGFAKVVTGTITLSSSVSTLIFNHGLGRSPDMIIVYCTKLSASGVLSCIQLANRKYVNAGYSTTKNFGAYVDTLSGSLDATEASFMGRVAYSGSTSPSYSSFASGNTYRWIAGVYAS